MEAFPELVPDICKKAWDKLDSHIVLNVNVPDIPAEQLLGIRFTRQGPREYDEASDTGGDLKEGVCCSYSGAPLMPDHTEEDMDVTAAAQSYITITPLQFDLTAHEMIAEIADWGFSYSAAE